MPLDTLTIYERLKAANLPEGAAKAIAELFRAFVEEKLVTKDHFDLKMKELDVRLKEMEERLQLQLAAQIKAAETRLLRWIFGMGIATITVLAALMRLLS